MYETLSLAMLFVEIVMALIIPGILLFFFGEFVSKMIDKIEGSTHNIIDHLKDK